MTASSAMIEIVSILTRPGGRVQLAGVLVRKEPHRCSFNPHPSRRTGATQSWLVLALRPNCFNPHPSRRTGATGGKMINILDWVVSILTRPGGRVQQATVAAAGQSATFQSSPVPEDGCNEAPAGACRLPGGFNPHPSRRTGATSPSATVALAYLFQSSPVPEDGCNAPAPVNDTFWNVFQSSPVPEDGCNAVQPH